MTDFIALLSTGKGTWSEVGKLMRLENWDNVFLVTNKFGLENFKPSRKADFIIVDFEASIEDIKANIIKQLDKKLSIDTAINIASGTGKEHAALISAALALGTGIRLITIKNDKMIEA